MKMVLSFLMLSFLPGCRERRAGGSVLLVGKVDLPLHGRKSLPLYFWGVLRGAVKRGQGAVQFGAGEICLFFHKANVARGRFRVMRQAKEICA